MKMFCIWFVTVNVYGFPWLPHCHESWSAGTVFLMTADPFFQAFLEVWESVVQMAAPGDKGESSPQVMDAQMHSCWVRLGG